MKETLKKQVESILKAHPDTRNSDITLTLRLWVKYYPDQLFMNDGEHAVELKKLFDLPREDNIKRIRAKLQNEEKKFLPTDEKVAKQRKMNILEWRAYLGYK